MAGHTSVSAASWNSTASDYPDMLVVDDDAPIVEAVCELMKDYGIAAESCPVGWEAQLRIRQQQPRVVLLDVQMPVVSGIDLFHLMRADPRTEHIPVIFFTANAHKLRDQVPNYEAMGAELLLKPFRAERLVDLVMRALAA